jgi:hypothetical protein
MSDELMVGAVQAELDGMPAQVQATPEALMAQLLAAKIDDGDWSVDAKLRRTLAELRRLAKPAPARAPQASEAEPDLEEEPQRDFLDDRAAQRAARRDELAARRARRPGAADPDRAGAEPRSAGDRRR